MENNEFKSQPFEPVPLHIPAPPLGEPIPEPKKPDEDGRPKPEMGYEPSNSDQHRGSMTIGRDGKVEEDEDRRTDDRMKQW